MIPTTLTILVAVAVTSLVVFERRQWGPGSWASKPTASILLVALAAFLGAMDHPYGVAILTGLVLSVVGDVALLLRGSRRAFLVGLVMFLLAHVAYAGAFFTLRGPAWTSAGILVALTVPAAVVGRWLMAHVPAKMRWPVIAYIVAISTMFAFAIAAGGNGATWLIPVGAGLFYLSDLFVARQRFVQQQFLNRAIGLPLYYTGQVMLAWSVAFVPAAI